MADGLSIKGDVIASFVKDCHDGIAMLSSSQIFTDEMAKAAGPNGGLSGALSAVEGEWGIRRGKLIEAFEKLMETIAELRRKYEDLDHDMAQLLARRDEPASDSSGTEASETPAGSSQTNPDSRPEQHTAPGIAGGDGGDWSGGTEAAQGGLAPQTGGPLPTSSTEYPSQAPDTPVAAIPPTTDDDASPLSSILAFADRWARLTGRNPAEVIALLVAGMGATGLIPAAILAQLGKPAAKTIPGEILETETGIESAEVSCSSHGDDVPRNDTGQLGGLAETEAPDQPEEVATVDPENTRPGSEEDLPSDHRAAGGLLQSENTGVDPETVARLQSDSVAEPESAPIDLPQLVPPANQSGGSSGGGGLDLPPLGEANDSHSSAGGAGVSPLELPDLKVTDVSEPVVAGGPSEELPDLTVAAPAAAGVGAAAMAAPMMRGMGGLVGAGPMGSSGGAHAGTAPAPQSGSAQREAQNNDAREVIEASKETAR